MENKRTCRAGTAQRHQKKISLIAKPVRAQCGMAAPKGWGDGAKCDNGLPLCQGRRAEHSQGSRQVKGRSQLTPKFRGREQIWGQAVNVSEQGMARGWCGYGSQRLPASLQCPERCEGHRAAGLNLRQAQAQLWCSSTGAQAAPAWSSSWGKQDGSALAVGSPSTVPRVTKEQPWWAEPGTQHQTLLEQGHSGP